VPTQVISNVVAPVPPFFGIVTVLGLSPSTVQPAGMPLNSTV
jgi:hypothetical protein